MSPRTLRLARKYGAHLRDAVGVDPAIITDNLGISEVTVQTLQRKLGLRKLTVSGRPNRHPLARTHGRRRKIPPAMPPRLRAKSPCRISGELHKASVPTQASGRVDLLILSCSRSRSIVLARLSKV
jgi:hypothetical protein